jgi:3D (Asp-Asp-Asp) domain-containing protein
MIPRASSEVKFSSLKGSLVLFGLVFLLFGCSGIRPPHRGGSYTIWMEATGYCPCGDCCGWRRSWVPPFRPIYTSGPLKGQPKKVGVTASGAKAKKGTVAADVGVYPFGTVMQVPGYGMGRVEDVGSAIQGKQRIDLFFKTHQEALEWGRQTLRVRVWR